MIDNQGTDTSQSANSMFDESVFTDTPAPQAETPESSADNTLTPTDAFSEPSGEEAPVAAPSQEQPKPLENKNDDTRYQYWQSQAAKRDNELKQTQAQLQKMQEMIEQNVAQQPEESVEEFPPPPERPVKPRNFNRQEAYEDPNSESARYLDDIDEWRDNIDEYNQLKNEYDNALVQERMQQFEEQRTQAENARQARIQQAKQLESITQHVQSQYGMTPEETRGFIETMSNPSSITVDNLVQLYRMQKGIGATAPAQGQPAQPSATFQQTQRAQAVPSPMGVQPTANNAAQNVDPADAIMDNMISDFKSKNPW